MTEPDLVAADAVNPTLPSAPGTAMSPPAQAPGAPDPILAMIERAARDTSVDIEKFERLMAMKERVEDRLAKQAFDNAIAQAKGEIGPIVKNRSVDFTTQKGRTNYRYEDFAAVAATVDPVLARHGLSYRFRSEQTGNRLKVTCRLSHADGYGEETSLEAANDESGNKNSIQSIGSTASYLQRYSLKLSLGLAASNDDDGRLGVEDDPSIDADSVAYVDQLLRDTDSDRAKFLDALKAESVEALTSSQYKRAIELLNKKKRKMAAAND
jgi:ERF superfamily